jgi:DNA-binding NtrC family response regulator
VDLAEPNYDNRPSERRSNSSIQLKCWLEEREKEYLAQKLNDFGGNVGLTAKSCGIALRTLSRKMHQYGLDKAVFKQKDATAHSYSFSSRIVLSKG